MIIPVLTTADHHIVRAYVLPRPFKAPGPAIVTYCEAQKIGEGFLQEPLSLSDTRTNRHLCAKCRENYNAVVAKRRGDYYAV